MSGSDLQSYNPGNPQIPPAAKRRGRLRWVVVLLGVIGAVAVVLLTLPSGEQDAVAVSGRATIGAAAPEVNMVDFDGVELSLSEYAGTPVVLNFWASWCPFCVAEMPDFERVHQRVDGQVEFIGVNMQDAESLARPLLEETGVTYRIAADPDGRVYGAFGGVAMPTTVFIDADGRVSEVVAGQMTETQLTTALDRNFGINA